MATSDLSLNDLPHEKCWGALDLHQWDGFWHFRPLLEPALRAQSCFKARNDDVLLASSMKTGTTWLKALIPCIMTLNQDHHDDQDHNDPLINNHPNALIPSLEIQIFNQNSNPDPLDLPSPRLFRTHIPYSMLSESVKNSGCKIVYITRDPKDTFVSLWHFFNTNFRKPEEGPYLITDSFDSFCRGVHPFGPFHDHVLEYWNESLKRPEKILFMRYEEIKRDTKGLVERLASFLEKPLANEEEVNKVIWRCSLERLKNLEINKNGVGPWLGVSKRSYFRLGHVGDWKNSLSMEMKERLDEITCLKLQGSGLDLLNLVKN